MLKNNETFNVSKKTAPQDWHRADIVAAFRKRNTTLAHYSRNQGYTSTWLAQATGRPYPRAERVIAEFLGVTPQTIWPSRYHADGTPRSGRGERGKGRHKSYFEAKKNHTPVTNKGNVKNDIQNKQAA
ncbi:MAG TPA: transcriptional regulator [Methylophilaceae bacterium]|nr:transcriptional regulator [Methylophilaceae bacterium]